MNGRLLGIGTAVPTHQIAQPDAAEMAAACCADNRQQARLLQTLYRRTTVRGRASTLLRPNPDASIDARSLHWFYPPAANGHPTPPASTEASAPAAGSTAPINSNAADCDSAAGADPPAASAGSTQAEARDPQAAASMAAPAENGRPSSSAHGPTTQQRMAHFIEQAPPLAERACLDALEDAAVGAEGITHLVVVTCTGFASPGLEVELIKRLGLRPDVTRTQVGFMGCHAALNGLQVAQAYSRAEAGARVLVCCVELCSIHFQYGWDSQRVTANALFADGAAAVVVGQAEAPGDRQWAIADTSSYLLPETEEDMSWHVGDHGFEMWLSPRVPGVIDEHVGPWVDGFLERHGMRRGDVASWAIHPGGPRIVTAVAGQLGLDEEHPHVAASRHVLQTRGNMSSATVLFILEELYRQGAVPPCLMLSFGPGMFAEAALLTTGQ